MSKRTERHESDRMERRRAYLESREQVSQSQLAANQANAQLSTGPVSDEGKAISSRNNTQHGLTVAEPSGENFRVLPTENQAAYDRNLAGFREEWKPVTATELDLVNRLVMHQWLRLRAARLQEALFSRETGELTDTKKFDLYRRYEATHERGFNKALADLQRLRAFQLRQQNGFESQRRKNEEHTLKMQRLQTKTPRLKTTPAADHNSEPEKPESLALTA